MSDQCDLVKQYYDAQPYPRLSVLPYSALGDMVGVVAAWFAEEWSRNAEDSDSAWVTLGWDGPSGQGCVGLSTHFDSSGKVRTTVTRINHPHYGGAVYKHVTGDCAGYVSWWRRKFYRREFEAVTL